MYRHQILGAALDSRPFFQDPENADLLGWLQKILIPFTSLRTPGVVDICTLCRLRPAELNKIDGYQDGFLEQLRQFFASDEDCKQHGLRLGMTIEDIDEWADLQSPAEIAIVTLINAQLAKCDEPTSLGEIPDGLQPVPGERNINFINLWSVRSTGFPIAQTEFGIDVPAMLANASRCTVYNINGRITLVFEIEPFEATLQDGHYTSNRRGHIIIERS